MRLGQSCLLVRAPTPTSLRVPATSTDSAQLNWPSGCLRHSFGCDRLLKCPCLREQVIRASLLALGLQLSLPTFFLGLPFPRLFLELGLAADPPRMRVLSASPDALLREHDDGRSDLT